MRTKNDIIQGWLGKNDTALGRANSTAIPLNQKVKNAG
jgi:hypothetical protein